MLFLYFYTEIYHCQMILIQALKTNVKLNTKKLYQADGYAVKELLKVATLLYDAQNNSINNSIMSDDNFSTVSFDISNKVNELKSTRQLASQLTVTGASLFDLLGREVDLREIRNSKVARQFDITEIEMALKSVIENVHKEIDDTKRQIENVKVLLSCHFILGTLKYSLVISLISKCSVIISVTIKGHRAKFGYKNRKTTCRA